MKHKWTKEETDWLKESYPKAKSVKEVAERLDVSINSIKSKARYLNLKLDGYFFEWTDERLEILEREYPHKKAEDVAKILGCRARQVWNKANKLGVKKDPEFIKQLGRNVAKYGKSTRFKKGHIPPNKGKKVEEFMSPKQLKNFRKTQFKKGNTPPNALSVGDKRWHFHKKSGKGYWFIKTDYSNKMVLLHKHLWEQENGKVPPKYIVVFKNKDTTDVRIENLECISIAENMRRNSIHNYPMEIKNLIRTNAKLSNHIKKSQS